MSSMVTAFVSLKRMLFLWPDSCVSFKFSTLKNNGHQLTDVSYKKTPTLNILAVSGFDLEIAGWGRWYGHGGWRWWWATLCCRASVWQCVSLLSRFRVNGVNKQPFLEESSSGPLWSKQLIRSLAINGTSCSQFRWHTFVLPRGSLLWDTRQDGSAERKTNKISADCSWRSFWSPCREVYGTHTRCAMYQPLMPVRHFPWKWKGTLRKVVVFSLILKMFL